MSKYRFQPDYATPPSETMQKSSTTTPQASAPGWAQPQTQTHAVTMTAAAFVALDLETGDAPAEAIEKAALLDASPILCVVLQTDRTWLILNGMDHTAPEIDGWPVIPCGDECGLLMTLRAWLDASTTPETLIVGHNILGSDLQKLRNAYIRHFLRLPEIIKPRLRDEERAEMIDTATLFKAFSMEHRDDFCASLDTVATSFGNGGDCPRLYAEGQIKTVLTYCAVDVATTTRAYLKWPTLSRKLLVEFKAVPLRLLVG